MFSYARDLAAGNTGLASIGRINPRPIEAKPCIFNSIVEATAEV
jgi:hypothetical protein